MISTNYTSQINRCSNPIVAVSVPNDVYLSYSILILTSVFRFVSFPLNLRTDLPLSQAAPSLSDKHKITDTEDLLAPIDGPPGYISLLGTVPFVTPPALSRPPGLPSNPRIAVGAPNTKTEFMLTPETLRYLGSMIEGFTAQIHDIIIASKHTEARAELQTKEFERQQQKCSEMLDLIEQLRGSRYGKIQERLERIREVHKGLTSKLDHRLQTLMQQASPKLSEYETKWFEELKRMKAEITGAGRYDEQSLAARTSLVSE
jgi:nucleoporin NUP82